MELIKWVNQLDGYKLILNSLLVWDYRRSPAKNLFFFCVEYSRCLNSMVYGRYNYSYIMGFISQQTQLGAPSCEHRPFLVETNLPTLMTARVELFIYQLIGTSLESLEIPRSVEVSSWDSTKYLGFETGTILFPWTEFVMTPWRWIF